jgi:hypothetical protein
MPYVHYPLGSYLVEAGLITPAQVEVILNDQRIMENMRFGDVLVARGWIKQQTLEYLIRKIVEPERQIAKAMQEAEHQKHQQKNWSKDFETSSTSFSVSQWESRREPQKESQNAQSAKSTWGNDRKALPSLPSDDGVSWVG